MKVCYTLVLENNFALTIAEKGVIEQLKSIDTNSTI